MVEDLKDILAEYRKCTLEIIKKIENLSLDSLRELIDKRQALVQRALNISCKKEGSKLLFEELQLNELQDTLNNLILIKLDLLRNEMQKISKLKTANNVYNNRSFDKAMVFSKKI